MSERIETHVLFDTENLFRPYGLRDAIDSDERTRLKGQFPSVPPEAALALGAVMAHEVVDWIDEGYARVESRSFGKPGDRGVAAVRRVLVTKKFSHTDVPDGEDLAEIEANKAATAITEAAQAGHIIMGGCDGRMLEHAEALSETTSGRWEFFILVPQLGRNQAEEFAHGIYKQLGRITLAHIRDQRTAARKHDPASRARFRELVKASLTAHAFWTKGLPILTTFDSIAATLQLAAAPNNSRGSLESWLESAPAELTSKGLNRHVARSVVAWASYNFRAVKRAPSNPEYELLFRAAVELYLTVTPSADEIAKIRGLMTDTVLDLRPELATAIERALASVLTEHP